MKNNLLSASASTKLIWVDIDWRLVEVRIKTLQDRIYIASKLGKMKRMHFLQNILLNSLDAKLLATRKVTTESKGRKTPGLDNELISTPTAKMDLVRELKIDGIAAPIRRVWIPKPGKTEKRPLGIPIIRDRAKQKLVLMALEPEWEAKFEPSSYGFRPGRSCHDAVEKIFLSLRNHKGRSGKPECKFILDADLKGCFDNIDHDYLLKSLNTVPRIEKQVRAWLKAGIFEGLTLATSLYGDIRENEMGTPQGGVISPFLANVALHGMENFLKSWIKTQTWPVPPGREDRLWTRNKISSITIVRYADDFIVTHLDKTVIENAKLALENWFASTSKLTFNSTKTRIIPATEGFEFLGFSFINIVRQGQFRIKIYPSKKKQLSVINKIGDVCQKSKSVSAYDLISTLRPIILGWANYFRYAECKVIFQKLDYAMFGILRSWVFRRDRRNNRQEIKERYFPSGKVYTYDKRLYKDNWILVGKKREKDGEVKTNYLIRFSWVASIKHVLVAGTNSVYDKKLSVYWSKRTLQYGGLSLRERTLLKTQKGVCSYCQALIENSEVEVDHIIPKAKGGKDHYNNLQLLHRMCHVEKTRKERSFNKK